MENDYELQVFLNFTYYLQDSSSGVVSSREYKPEENKCFSSEDSHSENNAGKRKLLFSTLVY